MKRSKLAIGMSQCPACFVYRQQCDLNEDTYLYQWANFNQTSHLLLNLIRQKTWPPVIKPGFYHKAQPGGFYGFYEGGFFGFYGFYVGFMNLKVYHDSYKQLLPCNFSVLTVLV